MPSIAELQDALINADKAGDAEAARRLADAIVAARNVQEQKPIAAKAGSILSEIPRQLGLTARYALEGPAQAAEIVTEPIRQMIVNPLARWAGVSEANTTGKAASDLADRLGLPKPQGADERVVGDMARMVAGSGGTVAAGRGLAQLPGMVGQVGGLLAANPAQQALSAAGAGGGAGAVREDGGSEVGQALGALAGGIAAPMAFAGITKGASAVIDAGKKALTPPKIVEQQIENKINLTLSRSGFDWKALDERTKQAVRAQVKEALSIGEELSPAALKRLIDFQQVGVTPTVGALTLNPVQITKEKNLAKVGANSFDTNLQRLALLENEQNTGLIGAMNNMGARAKADPFAVGNDLIDALTGFADSKKNAIGGLYSAARDTSGRSATLDGHAFTARANQLLTENLAGKLPGQIEDALNNIATGKAPLTVDHAEQIKTVLARMMRSTSDGNERYALGLVRQALEETPLQTGATLGAESIAAFNAARKANRDFMGLVERTPALKAVLDGKAAPDDFFNKFVVSGKVGDVKGLLGVLAGKNNPGNLPATFEQIAQLPPNGRQAVESMRAGVLDYIKARAVGDAADEVAKFSQSNYRAALDKIGERKLNLLFSADEVKQLQAIGRVASYVQVQPVGSAVNNSASGAMLTGGLLDMLGRIGTKIPLGVKDTITGTIQGRQGTQVFQPARGLLVEQVKEPLSLRRAPNVLGGLLAAPQVVNQP